MENLPQQNRGTKGVSIVGALAGMLVTFVGGICVGLHPAWLPIKPSGGGMDASQPVPMNMPATMPVDRPMTPSTAPMH